MGFLVKYSNFSEKIIEKYLIYVKEINDDINLRLFINTLILYLKNKSDFLV